MSRIVVATADRSLAAFISGGLTGFDHTVESPDDLRRTVGRINDGLCDLAIIDSELLICGAHELQHLRAEARIPLILLIPQHRTLASSFDLDADDYLIKPFSLKELHSRVTAIRARTCMADDVLRYGSLELNITSKQVTREGKHVDLTAREFALLEYLMRNSGRRLSRMVIMQNVWRMELDEKTNVVDVYINYLRKKIDHGFSVPLIHTVRGVGYQLGTP